MTHGNVNVKAILHIIKKIVWFMGKIMQMIQFKIWKERNGLLKTVLIWRIIVFVFVVVFIIVFVLLFLLLGCSDRHASQT
jgi:hypothetical protein